MKMQNVREIARSQGVRLVFGDTKLRLIQSIQAAESNTPCYGTDINHQCDQTSCLWRDDCSKTSKASAPA